MTQTSQFDSNSCDMAVIETPISLAVTGKPPEQLVKLTDLLRRAGLSECMQQASESGKPALVTADYAAGPESWMEKQPDAHLLYVMSLPAVAIAGNLANGLNPEEALSLWLNQAQSDLSCIRKYRRRVSLIFFEHALAAPQTFLTMLDQRLQLGLEVPEAQPLQLVLPDAILRLTAENIVFQSSKVRHIVSELLATALPLPDPESDSNSVAYQVFAEFHDKARQRVEADEELRRENQSLLFKLQQVQKQLKDRDTELRSMASRLTRAELLGEKLQELQQELQTARQELETRQDADELVDLQEENSLLLQQLSQTQEELERVYLKATHGQEELHELKNHLQSTEESIQALYDSKSWKVTKPLRLVLDLFTRTGKSNLASAENKNPT